MMNLVRRSAIPITSQWSGGSISKLGSVPLFSSAAEASGTRNSSIVFGRMTNLVRDKGPVMILHSSTLDNFNASLYGPSAYLVESGEFEHLNSGPASESLLTRKIDFLYSFLVLSSELEQRCTVAFVDIFRSSVLGELIDALKPGIKRPAIADSRLTTLDANGANGSLFVFRRPQARCMEIHRKNINTLCFSRSFASRTSKESGQPRDKPKKDVTTVDDPFDSPTYHIPEKPVTFTEGASYSLVILAGLGVAGAAGYAVFKELLFQPKEYKIFDKALKRIQDDSQVRVRIGSPIKGYGQESRNRAARQRIPNRIHTDEDGVEHVEINFYIRGPQGAGKVYTEMFKDKAENQWKYTYLIVEITSPSPARLMLESYLPA